MEDLREDFNGGRWNPEEHRIFEEALNEYGKNWKKIAEIVKTRTPNQVRSHAQKYLIKKNKESQIKETIEKSKKANPLEIYKAWAFHCVKATQYYQLLHTSVRPNNSNTTAFPNDKKDDKDSDASTA